MTKSSKNTDHKHRVVNYEEGYTYQGFWEGREYEDEAERVALKHYLHSQKQGWYIDLGGSFGRLISSYKDYFENIIIMDYATNEMHIAKAEADKLGVDIHLVAGNAYHLPFDDESIDGGVCVRVMHHLERPEDFFKELYRVLKPGSRYVVEFANKYNAKSVIKHALKLDYEYFTNRHDSFRLPHRADSQGSNVDSDEDTFIFDHSYPRVRRAALKNGFKIRRVKSVSWFRLKFIKNTLPMGLILFFERFLQFFFSWTKATPSIFVEIERPTPNRDIELDEYEKIEELLVDPETAVSLNKANSESFQQERKDDVKVWDLRFPKPE